MSWSLKGVKGITPESNIKVIGIEERIINFRSS